MNEAVLVGMSIMDTYFEKLDPKQESDDESDDDGANFKNKDSSELFIYETKDPYVLRSLPYLIGSQAFLDNDHVGLKDLDSDDEEIDVKDEDEDEDKIEKKEENELSETEYPENKLQKQDKVSSDSESIVSSDDDLFKSNEDKKVNLVFFHYEINDLKSIKTKG
jgi:WASH complex subunit FAM21